MNYLKRSLVITGILFIVIHFTLILIFCFSGYFTNFRLAGISIRYVFPVFNQNWRLFAPQPPLSNKYFYYRCVFDDDSNSPWIRSGVELLKKHKSFLFWNFGKQYYIAQSIPLELSYLDAAIKYQMKNEKINADSVLFERNKRIRKSEQYKKATAFFSDNAVQLFPKNKLKKINLLSVEYILPGIRNKNEKKTTETVIFPDIHFEK